MGKPIRARHAAGEHAAAECVSGNGAPLGSVSGTAGRSLSSPPGDRTRIPIWAGRPVEDRHSGVHPAGGSTQIPVWARTWPEPRAAEASVPRHDPARPPVAGPDSAGPDRPVAVASAPARSDQEARLAGGRSTAPFRPRPRFRDPAAVVGGGGAAPVVRTRDRRCPGAYRPRRGRSGASCARGPLPSASTSPSRQPVHPRHQRLARSADPVGRTRLRAGPPRRVRRRRAASGRRARRVPCPRRRPRDGPSQPPTARSGDEPAHQVPRNQLRDHRPAPYTPRPGVGSRRTGRTIHPPLRRGDRTAAGLRRGRRTRAEHPLAESHGDQEPDQREHARDHQRGPDAGGYPGTRRAALARL